MRFLNTFGGVSVEKDGAPGTGAAQQRKTLALLALLAAAGRRGMSRDKLIAYLWSETDAEHGRSLLKQACYALRRDLEAHELFLGTHVLRLNPEVITTDIQRVEDALDRDEAAAAVELYGGPFLDGFYLSEGGEFERWVEEERARWLKRICETLESLALRAEEAGDARAAVKWWRRLTALDRLSSHAALGLMKGLVAAGDRAAAIEFGRAHARVLRQDLGASPDGAVTELLQRLRPQPPPGEEALQGGPAPPLVPAQSLPPRARVRARLAVGVALVMIGGTALVAGSRIREAFVPDLIAVAPFEVLDPALRQWREGLVDLLSRDLDGAGPFRTVPPTSAVRRWEGRADRASARTLARRTGAEFVLFGALSRAGPDSVRLVASVLDARTERTLAEFDRSEHADRLDRLADSLSLDVLRALSPTTGEPFTRLLPQGTRSFSTLKAFLEGERYLRRFALDSAIASYERALALDTTFALALSHLGLARAWNYGPATRYMTPPAAFIRGLSPRDSLMVAYRSLPTGLADPGFYAVVRRQEATLIEMIVRFPDDPELWHEVGEVQFHEGHVWTDGGPWNRARRSFDRAIALDSGFALAYIHPVELALADNDVDGALRYVRGYLAIPSVNAGGAGMHMLGLLLGPTRRPRGFDQELSAASLGTLRRLAYATRAWPDSDETHITVARRLLEKVSATAPDTGYGLRPYRSLLAQGLIHRGHLHEARRIVGGRVAMPAFMQLANLGALPRDTVAAVLSTWFASPPDADMHVLFPWLLEAPCYRTLDVALWWAAAKDTASLRRLVRREDAVARTVDRAKTPHVMRPVPEFARAALALARGDTTAALRRFLALPDSSCPGAWQRREIQFRLLAAAGRDSEAVWVWDQLYERHVPVMLERARLAERLGDRPTGAKYYRFVVQAWLHADPELQPVVAEARAGLERVGGDPR